MPMIDVYAAAGTFADPKALARDLATALMKVEQVPDITLFRKNTAAFVHQMPVNALSNVAGDADRVRIQVLTNAAALDREKQLAAVAELTRVAERSGQRPERGGQNVGVAHRGARRRVGDRRSRLPQRRADRRGPSRAWPHATAASRMTVGRMSNDAILGDDGKPRCAWAGAAGYRARPLPR